MTAYTRLALEASLVAVLITATMDVTGYTVFSALPLIPLIVFYAWRGRLDRRALGFVIGVKREYWLAALLPVVLLMIPIGLVWALGAINLDDFDARKSAVNIALMASTGIIMVALTEEGFFRGVLWTLFGAALSPLRLIAATTGVFVIWHLSAVLLTEEYAPALFQVPIYLVNATLLGVIWGAMRQVSETVWVPAIYHSIWNALVYELFGFGTRTGALGVADTWIYGPELGLIGIVINGVVAGYYLMRIKPVT